MALPLLMFVFSLVPGEDDNILVMARSREEAHRPPMLSAGLTRAIGITGGPITSASIILADTCQARDLWPCAAHAGRPIIG